MYDLKTLLGGLSVEEFLEKYWQKQPLLVRQAIPGYQCPVTPEEIAVSVVAELIAGRHEPQATA